MSNLNIQGLAIGSRIEVYLIDTDALVKKRPQGDFRGRCVRCENVNSFKKMDREKLGGLTLVIKEVTPEGHLKLHVPKKLFPAGKAPLATAGLGMQSTLGELSQSIGEAKLQLESGEQRKTQSVAAAHLGMLLGHDGDIELVETEELDALQAELELAAEAKQEVAETPDFTADKVEETEEKGIERAAPRRVPLASMGDTPGLKLLTIERLSKAEKARLLRFMTQTEESITRDRESSRQAYFSQVMAGVNAFRLRLVNIEFFLNQLAQKAS